MATIQKKTVKQNGKAHKRNKLKRINKAGSKPSHGFEKAWEFWKSAHVDLSGFTFDREEANAR
jgi:hypothetical protein